MEVNSNAKKGLQLPISLFFSYLRFGTQKNKRRAIGLGGLKGIIRQLEGSEGSTDQGKLSSWNIMYQWLNAKTHHCPSGDVYSGLVTRSFRFNQKTSLTDYQNLWGKAVGGVGNEVILKKWFHNFYLKKHNNIITSVVFLLQSILVKCEIEVLPKVEKIFPNKSLYISLQL